MIAQQAHTALLRSLFLAAVLGAALPALAADKAAPAPAPAAASPYDPPALTFPENSITLLEAVRLTLQHQPSIMIQQQATRTQQGAAQVATGQFDIVITGNVSFSLIQSSLVRSQFLAEKKKRDGLQKSIDQIKATRDTALNAIGEYQQLQANPTGFRLSNTAEQSQFDVLNTTIRDTSDPAVRAIYEQLRSDLIAQGLATNQKVFDQSVIELAKEQQNLRNLGSIPKEQQRITGNIDMKVSQPGRTGVTAGFSFTGGFESDRYKGKPNQDKLGGKGIEDVYNYSFAFSVDAALLRGRGLDATGAAERAALIDLDASTFVLKHIASVATLSTVSAYWNLVSAMEQLDIAKKSAQLQDKRVEVTNALIAGDELPKAELARVLASQASDQGSVYGAARAVNEARVSLARAMGLSILEEANAPLAADPFPALPDAPALRSAVVSDLIATAVQRRYDRQAAMKLVESGSVLLRQAETDLRPLLDLHSQVSGGAIGETHFSRTSQGWSAPSFKLSFDFEKPLHNDAAKGRLLQRDAGLAQRSITAADLDRNIKANVVQILRSLQETADQVQKARAAVEYYGRTIENENEMYRGGQTSLIDTILTQQLQTSALSAYAVARQSYATLLAQLRFETGTIVREEASGNSVNRDDLVTLPSAEKSN